MERQALNTEIDDSVREAARNWYALASEGEIKAQDILFRFVAAYIAFIAVLTNKYSHKERGREVEDWQRIDWFSKDEGSRHVKLLENVEYRGAVKRLAAKPIHNMQRNRPNRRVKQIKNLKEILDCTRYVRNNLFHGGKNPGNARDRDLVRPATLWSLRL